MARIQSKTCGRKPPKISILPREIKAEAEKTLTEWGQPSRKWGTFQKQKKQDPKTQDSRS
jgi:hypothetical protein